MPSSPASMQCATTGRSDGLNQDYSRGFHLWFASRLDARHTVRRWFGEQRKSMKTPITSQGLPPYIYGWEVGPNEKVWSEAAVREALAAQALTAPNLACKSAQARLATQWGYVRAASVEPVGKIINSGGNTGSLPEHPLLVWLGGVPPVGTELYAGAPPAHIPADVEASGWCEYVAGMVGHWVRSDEYAGIKADEDRCTKAIAGIIERRLWALKHSPQPQAVVASSPAQAVDAVDGLREALRMGVECLRNQKSLHPEDFDELDERAVALLKAALATKEPK